VNHTTVAEHTFGLMIAISKHFWFHLKNVKAGNWKRETGNELLGKTIAILGMGRIGKEVAKRAAAFDMKIVGYDNYWDDTFAREYNVRRAMTIDEALKLADIVSLHMNLAPETQGLMNKDRIALMKKGSMLINTARGGLVVEKDIADAVRSGQLAGYGADVLDVEPMVTPHPFQELDNIIITPHVGSRTFESVQRQGLRAAHNIVNFLNGDKDFIQANQF
jgi:D-3-phosphoglycerate dehydrogenase